MVDHHRLHRPADPHITDIGKQHPDWFIHKPDGDLTINGDWHTMYILNTRNPQAIDEMVRPTYRALKKQGWDYVKIDGAGDLLYASAKPQCAGHFKQIGTTPEQSLRAWDKVAREHPWILSTTRHISQGGVDLLDVKWNGSTNTLSGKSAVVGGDPYGLTVYLPDGFKLKTAGISGEKVETASQAGTVSVRAAPSASKSIEWKLVFTR